MKKLLKLTSIIVVTLMFTSCLVDDTASTVSNDQGPNLVSFADKSKLIGGIANGDEYEFQLNMELIGPTASELSSSVSATVEIDPASTAVEGTHFRFDSKSITLDASANHIGKLPITLLTDGIVAPLAVSPVLYLNIVSATGDNVVNNGKQLKITMNYLCFSNLSGSYSVEMRYVNPSLGSDTMHSGVDVLNETGVGEYRTEAAGHWEIDGGPGAIGGTAGFDLVDVCNEITIPAQNLVNLYSNILEGVPGGNSVDPDTGIITFNYTVTASYAREYWATYTPL
ncbi:MAG: hypothetical protein HKO01_12495 [Flaviramulus sp.]|nr:hypothetical protein [Flaviramulus sp.]NNC51340.1 hypothetical protein [Flaviramulus sp.]